MLNAYGWIIVRSSRECYADAKEEEIDQIDDRVDIEDEKLWKNFESYIAQLQNKSSMMELNFIRKLNNASGVLNLVVSRNHSAPELYELLDWVVKNGTGSYGVVYFHDDECEFKNEFRVIRVNKGQYTEHNDALLSPIYPEVEYENWPNKKVVCDSRPSRSPHI